jgi:hypothetical protein
MRVCRFGSNVSGLCKFELSCNGHDPQGLEFKPPLVLWVYVIFLILLHLKLVLFFIFHIVILCCISPCCTLIISIKTLT